MENIEESHTINLFDLLSGKVVQNHYGTFWFKGPMAAGDNIDDVGSPIYKNLHRENDLPAAVWIDGEQWWFINGERHRLNGPAITRYNGVKSFYINGRYRTKKEFNEEVKIIRLKNTVLNKNML